MFCKNILEIWKGISFLEISSVFKDIVLAISEFYPLAQWRANTAGHSHNKLGQKNIHMSKQMSTHLTRTSKDMDLLRNMLNDALVCLLRDFSCIDDVSVIWSDCSDPQAWG